MSKKASKNKLEVNAKFNRTFSAQFKKEKVKQLISKQVSIKQICEIYSVSRTSVYNWLYLYSPHHNRGTKQVVEMESEALKTQKLLAKVAELERILGQKQLEIDYQSKLIELTSEQLGFDIKKKIGQQLSNGSGLVSKNKITS